MKYVAHSAGAAEYTDRISEAGWKFLPMIDLISYHIYQPLRSGRIWHKVNF